MSLRHIGTGVKLGEGTRIWHLTYIGDHTEIGTLTSVGSLTHIDHHVKIGDKCRIQGMVYIPPETTIGDQVFIGPGVVFTNDPYPPSGHLEGVKVESGAVICASAVIKAGVTIGEGSVIGMGAVVTKDVEPETVVHGHPARYQYSIEEYEKRRDQWIKDSGKPRS
ncbi:N-acetyltransferase [archaeon]|nr:N-acetyltransferase [archaeon]